MELKAPEQKPADATEGLKTPPEEAVLEPNTPADEPVAPCVEDVAEEQQPRLVFPKASSPEPVSATSPPPAEPSTVGAVQEDDSARIYPEPTAKEDGNSGELHFWPQPLTFFSPVGSI